MQKPGLFGMNGFIMFLLTCFSVAANAQQPGTLILIDAESKQAFTIRIGDQLYASSGQGHLVLSHLKDSTYKLILRFPKSNIAELVFPVVVHQKDLGFQLKGADSSWVLYNWLIRENIQPVHELDSTRILEQGVKREDGFSRLMAAVVNDSAVTYNTYTGNGFSNDTSGVNGQPLTANAQPAPILTGPEIKSDKDSLLTVKRQQAYIKDSLTAVRKSAVKDSLVAVRKQKVYIKDSLLAANKAKSQPPGAKSQSSIASTQPPDVNLPSQGSGGQNAQRATTFSGVKKLREISLKISRKMVFLDIDKDGSADTVTLFVFFETTDSLIKKPAGVEPLAVKKPISRDSNGVNSMVSKGKKDMAGLYRSLRNKTSDTTGLSKVQAQKSPLKPEETPACGQVATEADTESLRSAILKANTEQDKIDAASGVFAIKCFSVNQVRLLASLFVSDKARYRLMDAAHLHVADLDHFPELVDMLTDKNFQRKFLLMAEKRS